MQTSGGWGRKKGSAPGQGGLTTHRRPTGYFGVQSYIVRVADTDYNQFAIVFFRKVYKNQEYFKTTLYSGFSPTPSGTRLLVTRGEERTIPTHPPRSSPAPALL